METTLNPNTQALREYRRLCAWNMYQQGFRQVDIAEALQVTQGAVSQWIKRGREHGPEALRARKLKGRKPRLTPEQKAQLPALLDQGAEAFGFRGQVWTRKRVARLIEKQFGIRYCDAHISKLLRQIGYTRQKPRRRATQRDDAAIARWKQERLPALKKGRNKQAERCCM
jgi:transposase